MLKLAVLLVLATAAAVATASHSDRLVFSTIGDWGRDPSVQQGVADVMSTVMEQNKGDFIISNGDNIYQRGVSSVDDPLFKKVYEEVYHQKSLQVPWYLTIGNHDYGHKFAGIQAQIEYSQKSPRWNMPHNYFAKSWSVGTAVVDVVFVDTVNYTSHQQDWLEKTLSASKADYLHVVGHYPTYSGGGHGNVMEGTTLQEFLEKYEVTAYHCGHDHDLQHLESKGVAYFLSGGGSSERDNGGHIAQTVFHSGDSGILNCTTTATAAACSFVNQDGKVIHTANLKPRSRAQLPQLPTLESAGPFYDQLILDGDPDELAYLREIFADELRALTAEQALRNVVPVTVGQKQAKGASNQVGAKVVESAQ